MQHQLDNAQSITEKVRLATVLATHKNGSHILQVNFKDEEYNKFCLALNVRLSAKGELLLRTPTWKSAVLDVDQVNEQMQEANLGKVDSR